MSQLNQATQQSASSSEELPATAEEMSSQAEQLQSLMGFFKVGAEGGMLAAKGSAAGPHKAKKAPANKPVVVEAQHGAASAEFVKF